jgi:hypothetical protein
MSNSQQGNTNNQPLFQNVDAQEQAYSGNAERVQAEDGDQIDREAVVGSEGRYEMPTIAAQPTIGVSANMPVPPTAAPDLLTNNAEEDRDR